MGKFKKKPVIIEAIEFQDTTESITELSDFLPFDLKLDYSKKPLILKIPTLEGTMEASIGDWIIKGIKGEFYPCKPDIFHATYDAI